MNFGALSRTEVRRLGRLAGVYFEPPTRGCKWLFQAMGYGREFVLSTRGTTKFVQPERFRGISAQNQARQYIML